MIRLSPHITSLEALSDTNFYDNSSLYQSFIDFVSIKTASDLCYLCFYDEGMDQFQKGFCSNHGLDAHSRNLILTADRELAGFWKQCFQQPKASVINNQRLSRGKESPCGIHEFSHHSLVPLYSDSGVVMGVLGVARYQQIYTGKDAHKLDYIVSTAWALVCEKSSEIDVKARSSVAQFESYSNHDVLLDLIGAVSKALELRDAYTSNHMRNVSVVSVAIARQLGMEQNVIIGLEVGSLLHDIGKIALPAEILNKPGQISDVEYDLLKTHTTLGALMFQEISLPWPVKDMILQHHERIDGSGYPKGIKGHEICLEARIIAVADTFDAITVNRPYRYAPGPIAATETIVAGRGSKFDPYVVDAFIGAYDADPTLYGTYEIN